MQTFEHASTLDKTWRTEYFLTHNKTPHKFYWPGHGPKSKLKLHSLAAETAKAAKYEKRKTKSRAKSLQSQTQRPKELNFYNFFVIFISTSFE